MAAGAHVVGGEGVGGRDEEWEGEGAPVLQGLEGEGEGRGGVSRSGGGGGEETSAWPLLVVLRQVTREGNLVKREVKREVKWKVKWEVKRIGSGHIATARRCRVCGWRRLGLCSDPRPRHTIRLCASSAA